MAVCIRVSMRRAITYVDGDITTTPCRSRHALQEGSSRQRRRVGSPPVCAATGHGEFPPARPRTLTNTRQLVIDGGCRSDVVPGARTRVGPTAELQRRAVSFLEYFRELQSPGPGSFSQPLCSTGAESAVGLACYSMPLGEQQRVCLMHSHQGCCLEYRQIPRPKGPGRRGGDADRTIRE